MYTLFGTAGVSNCRGQSRHEDSPDYTESSFTAFARNHVIRIPHLAHAELIERPGPQTSNECGNAAA